MRIKKYYDQQNDQVAGKLLSYAGMSGAFLAAAAPGAKGQIVYTDVNPDVIVVDTMYDVDIDNDLMADYRLLQFTQTGGNVGAKFQAPPGHLSNEFMGTVGPYNYYYPSKLAAGAPIDTNQTFLAVSNAPGNPPEPSLVFAYATGNYYGNWNGQSGYVGVRFLSGGNQYYGWVELEVKTGGDTIILKSYAYESTPGAGIMAGDTATVIGIDQPDGSPAVLAAGSIVPNPVSNGRARLQLDALRNEDLAVEIYNGMGALLYSETRYVTSGKNVIDLDVSSLSGGAYFVKISDESTGIFRKLVIAN